MSPHDPSALSTPPAPAGPQERTAPAGRTGRAVRSWLPFPLYLLAFLAVYLLAVHTPFGQRVENALLTGDDGAAPAWIYDLSGAAYGSAALPPLEHTAVPTLIAGLVVIAAVAALRGRRRQGCVAVGAVAATILTKELACRVLPRPDLIGADDLLIEPSFPSGHAAVPAALVLGALLVASPRVRPHVLAVGSLWFAVTAAAVQATYHHRPSDVLGSTLLACAWHALATRLLPPAEAAVPVPYARVLPVVAVALSAVGALLAGARDDSLAQSLSFAASAFLCVLLLRSAATRGLASATGDRTPPHTA
ncbi:phosphatase PAP2 family protein [Streptomyces sp. NPDC001744]|uniref:phosphatase PAP2 family protein n=1 Tax=Streptomyces sp. NPDC001744 TaxID=3364606 RepID=UPI0036CCC9E6